MSKTNMNEKEKLIYYQDSIILAMYKLKTEVSPPTYEELSAIRRLKSWRLKRIWKVAFSTLDADEMKCVYLRFVENLSQSEIAEIMCWSQPGVCYEIQVALKKIKAVLDKELQKKGEGNDEKVSEPEESGK